MKHPLRRRRVKIIATLGPGSWGQETIAALMDAGADVFRLNMSHLDQETATQVHADIRAVEKERGEACAILMDLQGPKLRVGVLPEGGVALEEGAAVVFARDGSAEEGVIELPHPEIFAALSPGALLLLDDGRLRLRVESVGAERMEARVKVGGRLTSHKGVTLPGARLPIPALTDKDRGDLALGLKLGVDWVALSFVQGEEDVREARALLGGQAALMAKIERPAALESLEDILRFADGLMVARGDLGVELPIQRIPGIQKGLVRMARQAGKPVVVATQMLESMIDAAVPTRAEVSDVATAVFEGADAVMLSAETAVGKHARAAVSMMDATARQVEGEESYPGILHAQRIAPEATDPDAIATAAHAVSDTLRTAAIICYTTSGSTGLRVARERPRKLILAFTPNVATARRLSLVWGVRCLLTEDARSFDDLAGRACRLAREDGGIGVGERVIITAGVPFGTPGATNLLWVATVN